MSLKLIKIQKNKKRWKQYEIDFLKDNYKKIDINDLIIKLGRNKNSIIKKASRLKITKVGWTKKEDNFLKDNYNKYTHYILANMLNKSITGISNRLMFLKLKKSKKDLAFMQFKANKKYSKGKEHWNWKGGKMKSIYGYNLIYCPEHPYAKSNYVFEHRLVIECEIGRFLKPEEIVHHINKIKTDNRIKNLMLLPNKKEHAKIHYQQQKERKNINILEKFKKIEEATKW